MVHIVQPLFIPDMTNNSNDSLYSDIGEEEPAGGETDKFVGMVMRINSAGLTVYVPLERCYKLFVPTKCIGNVEVHLGDWIRTMAQRRRPREDDLGHQPHFSHLAIGNIEPVDITSVVPTWEQRFHGGIFEFRVLVEIPPNFEFPVYEKQYLVPAKIPLKLFIPCDRLDAIWRVGTTTSRFFEFWVTLANYIQTSTYPPEGVSLHLLDCNPIDEILPDGTVVNLGAARILHKPNVDECESEQLPYAYESDENSSPSPSLSSYHAVSPSQNHPVSSMEDVSVAAEQDFEHCDAGNGTQMTKKDVLRVVRQLLSNPNIKAAFASSHFNM